MSRALAWALAVSLLFSGCSAAGEKKPDGKTAEPAGGDKPSPEPKGVPVAEAELGKLFAEWGAAQKKVKTIVTRFSCSETSALLARPQVTGEIIRIKKPDGYRREVYEEKKSAAGKVTRELTGLMILKPPDLWAYMPRLKRVEHFNLTKVPGKAGSSPLKILGDIISFDAKRVKESFKVSAVRLPDGGYRMRYVALEGKSIGNVAGVRVWMKKGARFPLKIETSTTDEDARTESYSDTKFDEKLSDELFKFRRPRGVKLIRVTR